MPETEIPPALRGDIYFPLRITKSLVASRFGEDFSEETGPL